MKWVPWAANALAHPSLLPIALATFVSVAGPGGIAEFGRNMPSGAIVAVAPENPLVLANEPSPALLVRAVHEQTPDSVGPAVDAEAPPPAETDEVIAPSHEVSGTNEAPIASDDHGQTVATAEPVVAPTDIGQPPAGANTPEQPADDPADNGGGGDGNTGNDVDQPVDNDPPSSPPDDNGGAGEEPPDGDSGEQPSDGAGEGDTTGDPGEGTCDVPGNGHDKHDVEPGHDKNNDGIDDRCQPDEGDNEDLVDGECDVPGNGHDKHSVEPGHDKDGDGVDDRCQPGEGDSSGPAEGGCDPTQENGHANDRAGDNCENDDGNGSTGGGNEGNNGKKDDR